MPDRKFRGPIEDRPWPDGVVGHVVQPGQQPRINGYDVLSDLAVHYGFGEVVLTTLRGEAPSPDEGRAFEVAMIALAPISMADAPCNAAFISRLCGGISSSALAVGAIAACEQARVLVQANAPWLSWVRSGAVGDAPSIAVDSGGATAALLDALPTDFAAPWPDSLLPRLDAACLAIATRCGLTTDAALEAAIVMARLPVIAAEKEHGVGVPFRDYPMDLPPFEYVEDER